MLTPEEKKEIREIAEKKFPGRTFRERRVSYYEGMEAGVLKERERLLPLIESAFDYAMANRFTRYPNKVWEQFKTENNL